MKWRLFILLVAVALGFLYTTGPAPEPLQLDRPSIATYTLEEATQIVAEDSTIARVKPDNHATIVWHGDSAHRTPYVFLYLHGFSSSRNEGYPFHTELAKSFGANLYLPRLHPHGIDTTDCLLDYTAEGQWNEALEALQIAQSLGDTVIVMGTSTGGTLGLMLANAYPDQVHALLLLSPNIAINNYAAFLLNNPWGLQLARRIQGSKYRYIDPMNEHYPKYWDTLYRLEAVVELQHLVEYGMTQETFSGVRCPVWTGVYYADADHQDPVVRVRAIRHMMNHLGTPEDRTRLVEFASPAHHVLGSKFISPDYTIPLAAATQFCEDVLHLKAVTP